MKAMVTTRYGPPETLQLMELEKPVPKDEEVLVKIQAAALNYGDTVLVRGTPFISRLMGYGLFRPKHKVIGMDIAGQVEATGSHATRFKPGDEVFADISECGFGGFGEFVAIPEKVLVPKPAQISFEQAATVPQAAVVALQGLRDNGGIQSGQHVLINGASGGIGTFAIQIAKAFGAEVTAVCSARNLELVRSLGADHWIDYTQEDFTQNGSQYDLIFDIVANHSISDYLRALQAKGSYVASTFNPTSLFIGPVLSKTSGKKVSSLVHKPNVADLLFLKELLETGQVVPVIDRCFPLRELPAAMRYVEGKHHGKVVIQMDHQGENGNGRHSN